MRIKYLGPRDSVRVDKYGEHVKGEVKEYPDEFAEDLLATSVRQQFEAVDEGEQADEGTEEQVSTGEEEQTSAGETEEGGDTRAWFRLVDAARQAVKDGKVTKDGRPLVEAMEEFLGYDISAADRDRAFEAITGE